MDEERWSADALVARVEDESGIRSRARADHVLGALLHALGEWLPADDARELVRNLPRALGSRVPVVEQLRGRDVPEDDEFYRHVYEHLRETSSADTLVEGARDSFGFAREHAQAALAVLGRILPEHLSTRLERALPPSIADVLRGRSYGVPPPYGEHRLPDEGAVVTSLATGRPGARHPLAESHANGAQRHSVVREANPHGETKLSSARGLTQERLGRSLADGRGGPERPLSEVHDAPEGGGDEDIDDEGRGVSWVP